MRCDGERKVVRGEVSRRVMLCTRWVCFWLWWGGAMDGNRERWVIERASEQARQGPVVCKEEGHMVLQVERRD